MYMYTIVLTVYRLLKNKFDLLSSVNLVATTIKRFSQTCVHVKCWNKRYEYDLRTTTERNIRNYYQWSQYIFVWII